MIQFGICDDNKIDLTYIHELIQRFSNTYHDEFDYCVARFYDASSLLESVNAGHSFDILLMKSAHFIICSSRWNRINFMWS